MRGTVAVSVTFCVFSSCLLSLSNEVVIFVQSLMLSFFCGERDSERCTSAEIAHTHFIKQGTSTQKSSAPRHTLISSQVPRSSSYRRSLALRTTRLSEPESLSEEPTRNLSQTHSLRKGRTQLPLMPMSKLMALSAPASVADTHLFAPLRAPASESDELSESEDSDSSSVVGSSSSSDSEPWAQKEPCSRDACKSNGRSAVVRAMAQPHHTKSRVAVTMLIACPVLSCVGLAGEL